MSDLKSTAPPKLLVLGGPSSGKTTYRTQLYQRIETTEGELRLLKSVGNMTGLQGDVERLVQGLQPMHTHVDTYHTTPFTVEDRRGRVLTLEFADYGGEQIRRIGEESHTIPNPWVARAKDSAAWLFFLRIDSLRSGKSFMTQPVAGPHPQAGEGEIKSGRSAELTAIETLQRLLFVRGASLRHPLSSPRLGVLLSCWDELTPAERKLTPTKLLEKRAPLFSRFIHANWVNNELNVWGLSSTERKLPEHQPDLEFATKGPESFGYVVLENGKQDSDLTIPVNWTIGHA